MLVVRKLGLPLSWILLLVSTASGVWAQDPPSKIPQGVEVPEVDDSEDSRRAIRTTFPASGSTEKSVPTESDSVGEKDFRPEVMMGFSAVFVLIFLYLILSYRRNARLREELEFLKSRVTELSWGPELTSTLAIHAKTTHLP